MELKNGDKISVIAPSSLPNDLVELGEACDFLRKKSFNIEVLRGCYEESQTKENRISQIYSAFEDKETNAVICARGGFGAIKILDDLDYSIILKNHKIFAGSSDITSFLLAFYKISGLKTYFSPMLLGEAKINEKTFDNFIKTINGEENTIFPLDSYFTIKRGIARGVLWGGNLSTIVSLFGSYTGAYVPSEDLILFLEDVNEPVYKIDKMLTQITRNKTLKRKIKGVMLGDFANVNKDELMPVLKEFALNLNVPCGFGYPIGHIKNCITLPIGQWVEFSSQSGIVEFISQAY